MKKQFTLLDAALILTGLSLSAYMLAETFIEFIHF